MGDFLVQKKQQKKQKNDFRCQLFADQYNGELCIKFEVFWEPLEDIAIVSE